MSTLVRANLALLALLVVHSLDHAFNQPARSIDGAIGMFALIGFGLVIAAIALARKGHRFAPAVSVAGGVSNAAGFAIIHLTPQRNWLSDPYSAFNPNVLSWMTLAAPMVVGLLVAVLAIRARNAARAGLSLRP